MSERSPLWEFNIRNATQTMECEHAELPNLMDEVHEVGILSAEGGSQFSSLFVNRHAINDAPLLVLPGQFLADVTGPERQYEAYQFAQAFPDNPILLLDNFGHGHSDNHTIGQFMAMASSGDVMPAAKPMAEAVRAFREQQGSQDQKMRFVGISYGARISLAMARLFPEEVDSLTLFETPGLTDRWTSGLQFDYAFKETRRWNDYSSVLETSGHRAGFEEFVEQGSYDNRAKNFYGHGDAAAYANLVRSPLSHPGAIKDLQHLMTGHKDLNIFMASGSWSSISKAEDAKLWLDRVAELAPLNGHRFEYRIYPEDDHNMGRAEMLPRLASLAVDHVRPDWHASLTQAA